MSIIRGLLRTSGSGAASRRRAAQKERARLGRELHDGIVQGLIAVDMQLATALRRANGDPRDLPATIEAVQARIRSELVALRTLLDEAGRGDVAPAQLPAALDDVVWQFTRDCDLAVTYTTDLEQTAIRLPRRVCGELVRALREALVNVRRHSGARNVVVELTADDRNFTLSIQDDGRGFAVHRPPTIIRERVNAIGGRVRLAPVSRGARVELTIPREGPWKHAPLFESSWRTTIRSFATD